MRCCGVRCDGVFAADAGRLGVGGGVCALAPARDGFGDGDVAPGTFFVLSGRVSSFGVAEGFGDAEPMFEMAVVLFPSNVDRPN